MSVEAVAWALRQPTAAPTQKLVLLGLADHAAADGTGAWPSVGTLAGYAQCAPRTVQRHLRDLETAGLIVRSAWQPDHVRADRRPVAYDLPAIARRHDATPPTTQRGDTDDTSSEVRGDTTVLDGVTRVSPKPSMNRPTNPSPHARASDRRSPTRPLPDSWQPNDAHHTLAADEQLDCHREAAKFRDHAQATGRRMRDWDAAFRTWLRRAGEYAATQPAGRGRAPAEPQPPTETRWF